MYQVLMQYLSHPKLGEAINIANLQSFKCNYHNDVNLL